MKTINLKSQEIELSNPRRIGSGSTALGSFILILSLAGFFVSFFYLNMISSEVDSVSNEIKTKSVNLEGEEFKNLYDFQDRILELEKIEENKANQFYVLGLLEKYTLKEVVFSNLIMKANEGNQPIEIESEIISNDYGSIERQARIFESLEDIDNVIIKTIKTEKEKVIANLILKLKSASNNQNLK